MNSQRWDKVKPDLVLDFWFPNDGHEASSKTHREFWMWRMQGGADNAICDKFTDLVEAAAKGCLDHWALSSRGRLALIIALDQFPRSVWRNSPAAYAQDIKATRLALEGLENGHYDGLANVWEKQFYLIAISHCEGPEHLQRMERLVDLVRTHVDAAPEHLVSDYGIAVEQTEIVRDVIARFGRHPHRNAVLGRPSTLDEEDYIAVGEFPHERRIPDTARETNQAR